MPQTSPGGIRLASIHIYPLKAARAVNLDESRVEPWGLAGDRRWLLVDEDGRFISQREESSLARVVVSCGPDGIRVSAEGRTGLVIAEPPAGSASGRRSAARARLASSRCDVMPAPWWSGPGRRPVRSWPPWAGP